MLRARAAASLLSLVFALVLVPGTASASSPSFVLTGDLDAPRHSHTATLLANGKVLIAGGSGASLLLFDPTSGLFMPAGALPDAYVGQTATLLRDGRVLLAGGTGTGLAGPTARAFVYDPTTGTVSEIAPMAQVRSQHTATLLGSGKVLVAGGTSTTLFVDSAELFDPATASFGPTGNLALGRRVHTATLLPNGKVLIAGGFTTTGDDTSAELYDPLTGTFTGTGRLNRQRTGNSATLLPNGKVLIAGGGGFLGTLESAELYDSTTGLFVATPNMTGQRDQHSATTLQDGTVLLAGGLDNFGTTHSSAEIYDPAANTFAATASMNTPRWLQSATLLMDGRVLVAGGAISGDGILASAELFVTAAGPRTFVVNSTADPGDGACDLRECTFREAIAAANANPGRDTIAFAIAGAGPFTIHLAFDLPTIGESVLVDGATQPGYSGAPLIELDGSAVGGGGNGLMIAAGASTVRGLAIGGFGGAGIAINGPGDNVVVGNFLGTDASGRNPHGNGFAGVSVQDSTNNQIGGTGVTERNVISANGFGGIVLSGRASHDNVVQGNYIGTDATAAAALGNGSGIQMGNGTARNLVGGTAGSAGNVIAGNRDVGIALGGSCCNTIQGNYIGTNTSGAAGLGNGSNGIFVNFASANAIGGSAPGARNVISGNGANGILISSNFLSNIVQGNYIGVDPTGALPLGNAMPGVQISGGNGNLIGGATVGAGNLISANGGAGVSVINGARANVIQGNRIGTDASGSVALGNNDGIVLASAADAVVGGASSGAGNLISGNRTNGVLLTAGTARATITGNLVGTDRTGTVALPNGFAGIAVSGESTATQIGGLATAARNVISGNGQGGIVLQSGSGTVIQGNFVGTDASGAFALANRTNGIFIVASGNTVGGAAPGARNVISGNEFAGVSLQPGASANLVQGNFIGVDASGARPLGNGANGMQVQGANNVIGGTAPGAGNVISASSVGGIAIFGPGPNANVVQGNYIGTDATGTLALGNSGSGVTIFTGAGNTVGGATAGAGNLIAANRGRGVRIVAPAAGTIVQGNRIGTDAGGRPMGNGLAGVSIEGSLGTLVGGSTTEAGNTIAFNGHAGVSISAGTGISVLGNSIFANGELGIDLGPVGVTANDVGDADAGPNDLQNFPVLRVALTNGVSGDLNSIANATFRIELFANESCDPSGYGEGQTFLGSVSATTDASGNATFTFPANLPAMSQVTATATDRAGDTSEFSACGEVRRQVAIDIKPGGIDNAINPRSNGRTPVAVLSSPSFDSVALVDPATLTFGRTGDERSFISCSGGEDVNGDGMLDLICHFDTTVTGFQAGDTVGVLKGRTRAGAGLYGTDAVMIVGAR